ncbi:MAG: FAD:protein FMN transferase [Oscillospiraceae bacterium]|nr:FAD:protein FMN transferase [Oscillospiraceae bacterium]
MRKLIILLMAVCLLSGCGRQEQYSITYLTLFDTVTTITGQAESEAAFEETAQIIHDELLRYHQLFDIYNDYDGLNNLKTVNDQACITPVEVNNAIVALLLDCKTYYEATSGTVNAAMGSVLQLWHEARTAGLDDPANAHLPDDAALIEAAHHMDFDAVIIDEEKSTVFISDPMVQLDVGAIAKGWSAQRVCENAPTGFLISVGGNVCATGPKDEEGTPWVVAIQNPEGGDNYLHTLFLERGSIVTSGDYQRTYMVDGKLYHHIIDPQTLYPSTLWRSVTIVCADSGLADALSTALFVLPQEEGQKLLDKYDALAMWVDQEGNIFYSPGFEKLIRS